jgi:peptide/nickel transport system substrate-binding protein
MKRRSLLLAALLLVVCVLGNLYAGGQEEAAPEQPGADSGKKILYVAYDRELDVLNPFTSQMLCDLQHNVNEGLIITNDKNEYIPVLAKEIPTIENGGVVENDDGTYTMTWRLHEGVKWHDGEEFTAEDVKFTLDFIHNTPSVYNQSEYNKIIGTEIVDDYTIKMTWDGLYTFYAGLFEATLPEHILGDMSWKEIAQYEPFNRGPEFIGTGPFVFEEWKSGEYIRIVRNPDYWRGGEYPYLDEMVWQFIPDQTARFNAMKSGDYHIGQIEATQVEDFDVEGFHVEMIPSNVFYHIDMNVKESGRPDLFGDLRVRRAIYHAIDRQAIVDQLLEGTVTVANSPIPPTSPYHNPDITAPEYNPDKARELLEQAGWTDSDGDGVRDKNGKKFSFQWMNRSGRADRIAIAQVAQAQLKQVGIETTMTELEAAAWSQKWRRGQWDAIVSGWFMSSDASLTNYYHSEGSNNFTGFGDPELDRLMEESDQVLNFSVRKPLLDKAQQLLNDKVHTILLYYRDSPWVVADNLTNFRGSGTNLGNWWNAWEWDLVDKVADVDSRN